MKRRRELLAGIDGRNADFALMNAPAGSGRKASRIRVVPAGFAEAEEETNARVYLTARRGRARGERRPRKWSAATCPQSGPEYDKLAVDRAIKFPRDEISAEDAQDAGNVYSSGRIFAVFILISKGVQRETERERERERGGLRMKASEATSELFQMDAMRLPSCATFHSTRKIGARSRSARSASRRSIIARALSRMHPERKANAGRGGGEVALRNLWRASRCSARMRSARQPAASRFVNTLYPGGAPIRRSLFERNISRGAGHRPRSKKVQPYRLERKRGTRPAG